MLQNDCQLAPTAHAREGQLAGHPADVKDY